MKRGSDIEILEYLYQNDGFIEAHSPDTEDLKQEASALRHRTALLNKLGNRAGLSPEKDNVDSICRGLRKAGLVEQEQSKAKATMHLTPDGFEAVRNQRRSDSQYEMNRAVMLITLILGAAATVNAGTSLGLPPVVVVVVTATVLIFLIGLIGPGRLLIRPFSSN